MIPLPKLIDGNGNEIGRVSPILASVNLSITPLSSATLQLKAGDTIQTRALVEMFTINGSAGVFRARAPQYGYGDMMTTIELEHSISMLGDYLVSADIEEETTASAAISTLFSYYRGGMWVLGQNNASDTVVIQANHDTVLDAIMAIMEQIPGYMLSFDQSVFPWHLNIVQRPETVTAEGRLSRNISSVQIIYDDSELCTRAYMAWLDGTEAVTYQDADTVSIYGIVEKEISGYGEVDQATAQRIVNLYLAKHKNPKMSVEISAVDFSEVTGETLDKFILGNMFRLAIPDGNITLEEIITGLRFDDIYNSPYDVSITLAEKPDTVVNIIHSQESAGGGFGAGGIAGIRKDEEKEFKRFETFYEETDEKFSWLATDSEWDELSQTGHVTAFTQLTRTAHFVEDTAQKELPFSEWKPQWIAAHPEDASLPDSALLVKYQDWITTNPYAIYNNEYSDATRTERIISKTGINDLGQNETITSRVTQTADRLQSEISSTKSGVYSVVEQTLSGFRQVVSDDIAGYKSEIIQTQNTLRAEVANSLSDIYARILAWEGGGAIEVRNGNRTFKQFADPITTLEHGANDLMVGDIWVKSNDKRTWAEAGVDQWNTSNVYEWATYRGDDVYVWKDGRWQLTVSSKDLVIQGARLEVEQDEIWAAVDDTNNGLRAEMSLTASRFYQRLTDSVNGLSSTIEQTASQIRTEVHNANSTMYSSITETASQIRAEVSDTTNNLQTSITLTASQIRSEVSDTASDLQSSITQQKDRIDLVVEGTGSNAKIKPASIAAAINAQTGQSTVNISADKVAIDGTTTLGSVLSINSGGAIFSRPVVFTGNSGNISINNTKISAKTYQVDTGGVLKFIGTGTGEYYDLSANTVKDFVTGVQVVPDGNNYKLQKTTVYNSNWTDAGNFSRATTLSGAWSGSKYTVTASPQGNTKSIGFTQDSEVQLSLATNGAASEIPNGNRKMVSAPLRVYQTQGTTTTDRYTTSLTINAEAAWNHGWEDAAALTSPPAAGTDETFIFQAPRYYEKTQGNWVREQVNYNFTITKGATPFYNGYASVSYGGRTVGRISIGDWYTAGINDVGVYIVPETQTDTWYSTWDLPAGESITFYPAKWVINEFVLDEDHALTVTASGGGGSHDIACTSQVSSIGSDRGSRLYAGAISKSGISAYTYLGFAMSCGGTTQYFYITVNP